MTEIVWLLVAFVLLNVLDGFTTWLGIYRLPENLRAREANIVFKNIETHFWSAMIWKGLLVLFGCWFFYRFADLFALRFLNLVFVAVVLNNSCIYLLRRLSRRKIQSPTELFVFFFRKCHLPERVARLLGFYVLLSLVATVCIFIAGIMS